MEQLTSRKFRLGVDGLFVWVAPEPLEADPELTIEVAPLPYTTTLTPVHAGITVTALSDSDRRILTIDPTTGVGGLAGKYGQAWLITEHNGVFPVRVASIDPGVAAVVGPPAVPAVPGKVTLQDTLPRNLTLSGTTTLQFATWYDTLAVADVTGQERRDVPWYVEYDSFYGVAAPNTDAGREFGTLHVVKQPFQTGLTHNLFVQHVPSLGDAVPRNQQDWTPQIMEAMDELILWVRNELGNAYTEDNVPASSLLLPAHISLTKSIIVQSYNKAMADSFREQAKDRMALALKNFWLDKNNDLAVQADESPTQKMGSRLAPAYAESSRDDNWLAHF